MEENENGSNKVVTAIRIRPLSSSEISDNRKLVLSSGTRESELVILNPKFYQQMHQNEKDKVLNERLFSYDYIFWSLKNENLRYSGQSDIYLRVGKPIIQNCLAGLNCSLFAYGEWFPSRFRLLVVCEIDCVLL